MIGGIDCCARGLKAAARMIEDKQPNVRVKIVEASRARAVEIAEKLTRTVVLHGSALSEDVLREAEAEGEQAAGLEREILADREADVGQLGREHQGAAQVTGIPDLDDELGSHPVRPHARQPAGRAAGDRGERRPFPGRPHRRTENRLVLRSP